MGYEEYRSTFTTGTGHRNHFFRPTNSHHPNYRMRATARVKILIEDNGIGGQGRSFTVEVTHEILRNLWEASRERGQGAQDPPYFNPFDWDRENGSGYRATRQAQEEHASRRAEQERLIWEAFAQSAREAADAFQGFARQSGKSQPSLRSQVAILITDGDTAEFLELSDDRLYRKAKRACHPDTGGSHVKWLKLQDLAKQLGW